jgi:squalene-associated FAD-dependent desaturase
VIVVGGGWAGIAASVELARHDTPVILLESAKQLGGRARSVQLDDKHLDNGQHLLLGAYESVLTLLRQIGVREADVLQRMPLSLRWLRPQARAVNLKTPRLPAPLHLLWGLLTATGLSLNERLAALRFCRALQASNFSLDEDCSVQTLLQRYRQPAAIIQTLWEPLCLGALNTHLHEASAQIFVRTLGDSFNHTRRDSDLLLTRKNLGTILPEPAMDYIEQHHGHVRLGQRVTDLHISTHEGGQRITGVSVEEQRLPAQQVILATPAAISHDLIRDYPVLHPVSEQLQALETRPICTVYLQYPSHIRLDHWLLGSIGTVGQWVFDRGLYGQHGLMAVVISGDGGHMAWDNDTLCQVVEEELAGHFPRWPAPLSRHVIREKRATLASTVNVNRSRPAARTPVNGLWLAGDYTATRLPATLEGAVRSGVRCAQQVLRARRQQSA